MTRNSVVRYFNKTWCRLLQYRDYPTYEVKALSGDYMVTVSPYYIYINSLSLYEREKRRFFSYSEIKTEKELTYTLMKYCDILGRVLKNYYSKEV